MGAKSSNVTTSQHMLPLFQVVSDLEKPYHSNTSLQTVNSGYYYENTSVLTEGKDIVLHRYAESENLYSGNYFPDVNISKIDRCLQELNSNEHAREEFRGRTLRVSKDQKKRNKRRRRLKMDQAEDAGYNEPRYKSDKHRSHRHRRKVLDVHRKTRKSKQSVDSINNNYSTAPHGRTSSSLSPGRKKTGMFTEMSLNMYRDDGVDLSRHFKDLTEEDFNSDTENNATNQENSDCPTYEVPKDIIINKKRNRKIVHEKFFDDSSGKLSIGHDSEPVGRMKSKVIVKRYEEMLAAMLNKCQEKDNIIQEKDEYLVKLKAKLKQVLKYNDQFADENDYLKKQHEDMKICIDQYKSYVVSLEDHNRNVEQKQQATEGSVMMIGTCVNCTANEVAAIKSERLNARLNEDLMMLKNVVYRLNVQLSRYQDKLCHAHPLSRDSKNSPWKLNTVVDSNTKNVQSGDGNTDAVADEGISIPPLPTFEGDLDATKQGENDDCAKQDFSQESQLHGELKSNLTRQSKVLSVQCDGRSVWGDVNTHTLAPLLNAYQESIMEKDDLIRKYEVEFNRFTSKLKMVLSENDNLHSRVSKIVSETAIASQACGLATRERDELRRDCSALKEKCFQLEKKLKDVHECYEQKVESMSRDYTMIHQEYFKTKTGLATVQGRCQVLQHQCKELQGEATIPAKVHHSSIDECKRLFEELKSRYTADKNRMSARLSVLQDTNSQLEKRLLDIGNEKQRLELKVKNCDRIIRKCRRDAISARNELTTLRSSLDASRRRTSRATNLCRQLALALEQAHGGKKQHHMRAEKMSVQKEALRELDAVEVRIKEQDRNMELIKDHNQKELSRFEDLMREKDATIEAMRRHINKDRLERYSDRRITARLPADLTKKTFEEIKKYPAKPPRKDMPSTALVSDKGDYVFNEDSDKFQ